MKWSPATFVATMLFDDSSGQTTPADIVDVQGVFVGSGMDWEIQCRGTERFTNVTNGIDRPTRRPNAWVADFADARPTLRLTWEQPQTLARIELSFDTDFDHPMESVLMGHPERAMPFCVRQFEVRDGAGRVLYHCEDNHQTRCTIRLSEPVTTERLSVHLTAPGAGVPLYCAQGSKWKVPGLPDFIFNY